MELQVLLNWLTVLGNLTEHNWIRTNRGGAAKIYWAQGRKVPKYGPVYSHCMDKILCVLSEIFWTTGVLAWFCIEYASAAGISHVVADVEAPGGEKWENLKSGGKQWQATPKNFPRMQRTRAIPVAWLKSGLCPDRPKGWIRIIIIIIIIIIIKIWFFFVVLRPKAGPGLLIHEVSRSHSDSQQSVGLVCTRDQTDAETSTWQHTTLTTHRHQISRRDSKPQSHQTRRP